MRIRTETRTLLRILMRDLHIGSALGLGFLSQRARISRCRRAHADVNYALRPALRSSTDM